MRNYVKVLGTIQDLSKDIKKYIRKLQNFILWHYQFGSRYDTPFWNHAKSLVSTDETFNKFFSHVLSGSTHFAGVGFGIAAKIAINVVFFRASIRHHPRSICWRFRRLCSLVLFWFLFWQPLNYLSFE